MNTRLSSYTRALRASLFTATVALPIVVAADQPYSSGHDIRNSTRDTTLVDKVRKATARFRDINIALNDTPEHWVPATPCVSGPDFGAMGVHLILPSRVGDGALKADEPEALIYEPLPNGSFRLVGVEFIVLQKDWVAAHPGSSPPPPPEVDGHLTNFVPEPNRFGLPAFYELHVWAWQNNPSGSFADWNTQVSCDHQASE